MCRKIDMGSDLGWRVSPVKQGKRLAEVCERRHQCLVAIQH
jgi:hypothetical protein